MIYSQESIIGLSLYEAMMRLTGGRDPEDYYRSIELNPRQRIGVGREYRPHARAYVPVRRDLPEQSDARRKYLEERGAVEREWSTLGKVIECDGKIEKKAADECAELIRPLFADLKAGKLQVQCRDMAAPLSTPVPVPPDFWEGPWDLVLKDGDTTLTVKSAAQGKISGRFGIVGKYRVLKIQSATAQAELQAPPAAVVMPEAPHIAEPIAAKIKAASKRRPRGQSKEDEIYFPMIERILSENPSLRSWAAIGQLCDNKTIPFGNSDRKSVIERVRKKYLAAGRPDTHAGTIGKALASQK